MRGVINARLLWGPEILLRYPLESETSAPPMSTYAPAPQRRLTQLHHYITSKAQERKKRDIFSSLLGKYIVDGPGKLSPNHNDISLTGVLSVYTNCLSHHSVCTVAGVPLIHF